MHFFFFGGLLGLFALAMVVLIFVFWLWMLVDCIQNPALDGTEKLIWALVILFLHVLGAVLYYLIVRSKPAM